jgi:hypothetical protein
MGLAVAEFKEKRSKEPEDSEDGAEDSEDGAATAEITKKISDEDLDAIVEGLPASFGPKADLKVIFINQQFKHIRCNLNLLINHQQCNHKDFIKHQ